MDRILTLLFLVYNVHGLAQGSVCFVEQRRYEIASGYDLVIYQQNRNYLFQVMRGQQLYDVCAFNNVESPR